MWQETFKSSAFLHTPDFLILLSCRLVYSWDIPPISLVCKQQKDSPKLHKAITVSWPLTFLKHFWASIKLLLTLTVSIFINQLKYPVHHLVWGQQVAVSVKLSMTGFLQSINGLRVMGNHVTATLTQVSHIRDSGWTNKYYLYNFKKLGLVNASTSVFIVHFECPFKLMLQFAP